MFHRSENTSNGEPTILVQCSSKTSHPNNKRTTNFLNPTNIL
jgi:hypothetical protein